MVTDGEMLAIRITPARAGKSMAPPPAESARWDHPRACGEEKYWEFLGVGGRGSPPRVRGRALYSYCD